MRRRKQQEKELEASEELLLRARRRSIDGVVVNQRCVARPKKPKPGYGYPLGCHTIIMAWHGWSYVPKKRVSWTQAKWKRVFTPPSSHLTNLNLGLWEVSEFSKVGDTNRERAFKAAFIKSDSEFVAFFS